jgi:hypothetical protein
MKTQGANMSLLDGWEPLAILAVFLFLIWSIGVRLVLVLNQVKRSSRTEREIVALLERAAVGMSRQSPEQEVKEVVYLLEALGHRMDRETYRRVLEQVQVRVAANLSAAV